MTATIASLEELLARRRAAQEALTPAPAPDPERLPLVGIVAYSDGSWRVTEQIADTGEAWRAAFRGLAGACEALQAQYKERLK